jgi:hypothetical protein
MMRWLRRQTAIACGSGKLDCHRQARRRLPAVTCVNGADVVQTAPVWAESGQGRLVGLTEGRCQGHMGCTHADTTSNLVKEARSFLGGEDLPFAEADALWRRLKDADELALARTPASAGMPWVM